MCNAKNVNGGGHIKPKPTVLGQRKSKGEGGREVSWAPDGEIVQRQVHLHLGSGYETTCTNSQVKVKHPHIIQKIVRTVNHEV